MFGFHVSANAVSTPSITVPTNLSVASTGDTQVQGIFANNLDLGKQYQVSLALKNAISGAHLYFTNYESITASYGFSSSDFSNFTSISFIGYPTGINSVLSSLYFHASGSASQPSINITIFEQVPGIAYFPQTGHFYKVGHFMSAPGSALGAGGADDGVFCESDPTAASTYEASYTSVQTLSADSTGSANCSWQEANRLARSSVFKGQSGYLANITSAAENTFLKDKLQGAVNVWMGGTDGACDGSPSTTLLNGVDLQTTADLSAACASPTPADGGTEGLWHWYDGPEKNKAFWRSDVPYYTVSQTITNNYNTSNLDYNTLFNERIYSFYVKDAQGNYQTAYLGDYLFQSASTGGNPLFPAQLQQANLTNWQTYLSNAGNYFDYGYSASTDLYDSAGTLISECGGDLDPINNSCAADGLIFDFAGNPLYLNYNQAAWQDYLSGSTLYDVNGNVVSSNVVSAYQGPVDSNSPIIIDQNGSPTQVYSDSSGDSFATTSQYQSWTVPTGYSVISTKECVSYLNSGSPVNGAFTRWDSGQPNNSSTNPGSSPNWDTSSYANCGTNGSVEDNIVFNLQSSAGTWDDLNAVDPAYSYYGYIIEYGDDATPFSGVLTSNISLLYQLTTTTSCSGVGGLINGDFESLPSGIDGDWSSYGGPAQYLFLNDQTTLAEPYIRGWNTSESDHQIEIERHLPGFDISPNSNPDLGNVVPASGNYMAELNANSPGTLYQDVSTVPGEVLRWSLFHRGRTFDISGGGFDSMEVKIGPTSDGTGDTSAEFADPSNSTYAQIPTVRPPDSGDPEGPTLEDARGSSSVMGGLGASDQYTSGGHAGGWGYYEGVYVVPAGQTTTRFGFVSLSSANGNSAMGNLLDDIQFTPLVACPATINVVSGRTFNVDPFNLDHPDESGSHSAYDSFGQPNASVLSVSSESSMATTTDLNGVTHRGILYTAPSTPGSDLLNFEITNTYGDVSESSMLVNVLQDSDVRATAVQPFDPRSNPLITKPTTVKSAGDGVLVCVDEASSSNQANATSSIAFSASNSSGAAISGGETNHLEIRGTLTQVNGSLQTLRIRNTQGSHLVNGTKLLIRSVLSGTYLGTTYGCSDAAAAGTRVITLKELHLTIIKGRDITLK
jgi:hypothetical protein